MSVTIDDFSHFASYKNCLYIYKTPDSTDYTISLVGANIPDEVTTDTERFLIKRAFAMGLVFRALSLIADLNGDEKASDRFLVKSRMYEIRLKQNANKQNFLLNKIIPYSFLD